MLNPKKHPLEIFRERGRHRPFMSPPGASTPPTGDEAPLATVAEPGDARGMHPRWEPRPFELHLSLLGTLMVAMLWIVLLAGAYTLGVKRGSDQSRTQNDANAKALGKQIEGGADGAASGNPGESNPTPASDASPPLYGVLVLTMPKSTSLEVARAKRDELRSVFESRYQIPHDQVAGMQLLSGEFEYYVGKYESKDDPDLTGLLGKIRVIADWPSGKDSSPFRTAVIKVVPNTDKSSPPAQK